MTGFVPPKPPVPVGGKPNLKDRIGPIMRSSLTLLQPGSYRRVGMTRFSVPTLPKGEKRYGYVARDPEVVREMLVNRPDDFPKSVMMAQMLKSLTGDSIFTTNGEVWKRQRKLIDPSLEAARIKDSFERMRQAADQALIDLEASARDGATVQVEDAMTHYAADIIFRTIFSEPLDARSARQAFAAFEVFQGLAYSHGMVSLTRIPTFLFPGTPRATLAAWKIRRVMQRPLKRRMAEVRAGAPPRNDILGALLQGRDDQGKGFSERELLDQICMLFLAGHETSAAAASWALYLIAACPDVQDRMRTQVAEVAGDGPLEFSHLKRLTVTRDVFREALRLYPPVAFVARDTTRPEKLRQREVEAGAVVFLSSWLMHRNAGLWSDPDVFDPDRFETPEGREALKCAYMPFSVGPRVCPGAAFALQEGALILAMTVRRFRLSVADGHVPDPTAKLTLRSANGVQLNLETIPPQSGSTTTAVP